MSHTKPHWRAVVAAAACAMLIAAAASGQSTSTMKRTVTFDVVAVDGNTVLVNTPAGPREYVAAEGQKFTVDGKEVTVQDLKPGMKGSATITTTTKTIPVHTTTVKNGEVVQASGASIIVRTDQGIKMFTEKDVADRNMTIVKDGQPAKISDFRQGDRLTATIVTPAPPKVLTEEQLQATMTSPAAATSSSGAAAKSSSGAAARSAAASSSSSSMAGSAPAATHHKSLPKTASNLPLLGLIGLLSLAAGMSLTARRVWQR